MRGVSGEFGWLPARNGNGTQQLLDHGVDAVGLHRHVLQVRELSIVFPFRQLHALILCAELRAFASQARDLLAWAWIASKSR